MSDLFWIDLDRQMPPQDVPVLVRARDGTVSLARLDYKPAETHRDVGEWVGWGGVGFGGDEWDWDWEGYGRWRGVTHWCPLPDIEMKQEKTK